MTTIQDTGPSAALLASMNPSTDKSKSVAADAQDRFMTLLVTQMKNQDPLNPLDNAQVTSQLAQLSTVTGIDKLNTSFEGLMASYQSSQSLQAAGMIGHGVLVPGSTVELAGSKGVLGMDVAEPADAVQVTIRDAAGKQIRQMNMTNVDSGMLALPWDGLTDAGAAAVDGQYTFDVTATRGGQKVAVTPLTFGQVGSVSTSTQGVKLNVTNVGSVNLGDVRQIL